MDGGQEARAHKQAVAAAYDRLSGDYDQLGPRLFAHFGARLVELAAVRLGDMVLDVATGRGASLFPAAARVGDRGRVVGIDLAAAMVEHTTAELRQRGLMHADLRQMDAEHLEFADASFDAVLCGFALHHLPQPAQALREFARVLRPGGTVAVSTWADRPALVGWLRAALRPYGDFAAFVTRPFDTADELAAALRAAGFRDVQVVPEATEVVYPDEAAWWRSNWAFLQREALDRLPPDRLAAVRTAAREQVRAVTQPDGVHQRWGALVALGTKPRP